jgi:hypothetical protein
VVLATRSLDRVDDRVGAENLKIRSAAAILHCSVAKSMTLEANIPWRGPIDPFGSPFLQPQRLHRARVPYLKPGSNFEFANSLVFVRARIAIQMETARSPAGCGGPARDPRPGA